MRRPEPAVASRESSPSRARRQKRLLLSLVALGFAGFAMCAVVFWRGLAVQYHVYRLRWEPDYLRRVVLDPRDSIEIEALRRAVGGSRREARFRRQMAGRMWESVTLTPTRHILGARRTEHRLAFEESPGGYHMVCDLESKYVAGARRTGDHRVFTVIVDGCFVRAVGGESGVDTWGVSYTGALLYPAVVRLRPGRWVLVSSLWGPKPPESIRYWDFGRPLEQGASGRCRLWWLSTQEPTVNRGAGGEVLESGIDFGPMEGAFVVSTETDGQLRVDVNGHGFTFDPKRGVGRLDGVTRTYTSHSPRPCDR